MPMVASPWISTLFWVPKALESIEKIIAVFSQIGFSIEDLQSVAPEIHNTKFIEYARDPKLLRRASKTWEGAARFFEVRLNPEEGQKRVQAKLQWLSEEERDYWAKVIRNNSVGTEGIEFLALSLDDKGNPIPVANTDPATWLFLDNFSACESAVAIILIESDSILTSNNEINMTISIHIY